MPFKDHKLSALTQSIYHLVQTLRYICQSPNWLSSNSVLTARAAISLAFIPNPEISETVSHIRNHCFADNLLRSLPNLSLFLFLPYSYSVCRSTLRSLCLQRKIIFFLESQKSPCYHGSLSVPRCSSVHTRPK